MQQAGARVVRASSQLVFKWVGPYRVLFLGTTLHSRTRSFPGDILLCLAGEDREPAWEWGNHNVEAVVEDIEGLRISPGSPDGCAMWSGALSCRCSGWFLSPLHQAREFESLVMLSNIEKENLFQLAETKYWQWSGADAYKYRRSIIGKEQLKTTWRKLPVAVCRSQLNDYLWKPSPVWEL